VAEVWGAGEDAACGCRVGGEDDVVGPELEAAGESDGPPGFDPVGGGGAGSDVRAQRL
jgi:hypothetical protein